MSQEKKEFVEKGFISFVNTLQPLQTGAWGKMNAQQMVEHVTDFFDVASGKMTFSLVSPEEHLPKLKAFLWSDKPFRENTKAPAGILGEEPVPVRNNTMQAAARALQKSIDDFFDFFEDDPLKTTSHPVFGALNLEEWIQLHHKHLTHHARQFGWMPATS